MEDLTITSWSELQDRINDILERINADESLASAAAVNPLLAVEELGYRIHPDSRADIELRLRFGKTTAKRLAELRFALSREAGRDVEPDDPQDVCRLLFDDLQLASPPLPANIEAMQPLERVVAPLVSQHLGKEREDPLDYLRDAHPALVPLLEYRRLEASRPRLASAEAYAAVRNGEVKLPVIRLRARLKTQNPDG